MLNIAMVEDSDSDAKVLSSYLGNYFNAEGIEYRIQRFDSSASFLNECKSGFDIVFMDIELPDDNGLEAAKRFRCIDESAMIMFVTNMAQFAVNGYEVDAFDFIVKPVKYATFVMKMNRAMRRLSSMKDVTVCIKTENGIVRANASSIKYVETLNHGVVYHLASGEKIISRDTMKKVENELTTRVGFFKCNRCYLVNLKHVRMIKDSTVIVGDDELLISRPRKKEFLITVAKFLGGGN